MHVYANGVTEWFVAETAEEAAAMAREHYDEVEVDVDEGDLAFRREPDEKTLSIVTDDYANPTVKTCAEWAAENGKGFLATTEY